MDNITDDASSGQKRPDQIAKSDNGLSEKPIRSNDAM